MENSPDHLFKAYREQIKTGKIQKAYNELLNYIMGVRNYFSKKFQDDLITGNMHQGHMDITFFTFTPVTLKKYKLKVVIVFNHIKWRFEIWLAAQNRAIQKQYAEIFRGSDWDLHHIPAESTEGFAIVDDILIEDPDFNDQDLLTEQIESEAMKFIRNIEEVLI